MATIENITNGSISLETVRNSTAYPLQMIRDPFTGNLLSYPGYTNRYILSGTTPFSIGQFNGALGFAANNGFLRPPNATSTVFSRLSLHAAHSGEQINSWDVIITTLLNHNTGNVRAAILVPDDFDPTNTGLYQGIYPTQLGGGNLAWKLSVSIDCIHLNEPCIRIPSLRGVTGTNNVLTVDPNDRNRIVATTINVPDQSLSVTGTNTNDATASVTNNNVREIFFGNNLGISTNPVNPNRITLSLTGAAAGLLPDLRGERSYVSATQLVSPTAAANSLGAHTVVDFTGINFSSDFNVRRDFTQDLTGSVEVNQNIIQPRLNWFVTPETINSRTTPSVASRISGTFNSITLGNNLNARTGALARNDNDIVINVDDITVSTYDGSTTPATITPVVDSIKALTFDIDDFALTDDTIGSNNADGVVRVALQPGGTATIGLGYVDEDGVVTGSIVDSSNINFDSATFSPFTTGTNNRELVQLNDTIPRVVRFEVIANPNAATAGQPNRIVQQIDPSGTIITNASPGTVLDTTGAWTINHGLGISLVMIQVFDSSMRVIIPDEITLTSNTATINFGGEQLNGYVVVTG